VAGAGVGSSRASRRANAAARFGCGGGRGVTEVVVDGRHTVHDGHPRLPDVPRSCGPRSGGLAMTLLIRGIG
jgi:hypothetical protein